MAEIKVEVKREKKNSSINNLLDDEIIKNYFKLYQRIDDNICN